LWSGFRWKRGKKREKKKKDVKRIDCFGRLVYGVSSVQRVRGCDRDVSGV
jgi:hypothetical protein